MRQETIIEVALCALLNPHPSQKWQFIKDQEGFYANPWFDVNALNEKERKEYDETESFLRDNGIHEDAEFEAYVNNGHPRFPTLELAKQWAALMDRENNITEDLQSYNAPSECYTDAYTGIRRDIVALLEQSTKPEQAKEILP